MSYLLRLNQLQCFFWVNIVFWRNKQTQKTPLIKKYEEDGIFPTFKYRLYDLEFVYKNNIFLSFYTAPIRKGGQC